MIAPVLIMVQKEAELQPRTPDIERELNGILRWAEDWSNLVWQRYRSSFSQLSARGEAETEGVRILLAHIQHKEFGTINLLQLTRTVEKPNHPLVAQLFYTEDFKKLLAISFKWPRESHVLSEYLSFPHGTVEEMVKVTNPQVLFSAPEAFLGSTDYMQRLELYFYYKSRKDLKDLRGWLGGIGFAGKEFEGVIFHNGVLRGKVGTVLGNRSQGFYYLYQGQPYELPKTLNPLPHIRDFGSHRLVKPLILPQTTPPGNFRSIF